MHADQRRSVRLAHQGAWSQEQQCHQSLCHHQDQQWDGEAQHFESQGARGVKEESKVGRSQGKEEERDGARYGRRRGFWGAATDLLLSNPGATLRSLFRNIDTQA